MRTNPISGTTARRPQPAPLHLIPDNDPAPTFWALAERGEAEARLDAETAAMLRALLRPIFAGARSWAELHRQLAERGFALAFERGRLVLRCTGSGMTVATTRFLGYPLALLAGRLGRAHAVARGSDGSGELLG